MIFESLKYIRLEGKSKEWAIEAPDKNAVRFGNINLMVGKNAAGKSRTLSVIREISGLFSGMLHLSDVAYSSAKYWLTFKDEEKSYVYFLEYENRHVIEETLHIDGVEKLIRSKPVIYNELEKGMETFSIDTQLSSVSLHEIIKYPYLNKLFKWAFTLKMAEFTNQFEKNFQLQDISQLEAESVDSTSKPISLLHSFWMGKQLFGNTFTEQVKKDMNLLNYSLETIDIKEGKAGYSIYVKEDELEDVTTQQEMSQGMFRVLSFVIQLNFALMSKLSVCVLVDDLGEGLDFDRSKILINMLVDKIEGSNIQIFMTSNDRYIMNKIPLKYWSVIRRYPKKGVFYNYYNSKQIFDDFQYTGLSNFDFLATDFYYKGFESIED